MSRIKPAYDVFPPPPDHLVLGDPAGPPLVVIVGPTGVGKSELALRLAEANRGAIVSCDSRQVYEGFDIGTASPTADEIARVPHDLVNFVAPDRRYTVSDFQSDARSAIATRRAAGYLPFLVGGTGLYMRAVLDGLTLPPESADPTVRDELRQLDDPHTALAEVDPEAAARLHPNDRFRVVRALEVFRVTGRPIGEFQQTTPCPYRLLVFGVGTPRIELYQRIDARVLAMRDGGFLAEIAGLAERWGWDLPLMSTLGYAELGAHLRGELGLDEATALMAQHTRNYAKRQLTWFRAEPRVRWLVRQPDESVDRIAHEAAELLRAWALA